MQTPYPWCGRRFRLPTALFLTFSGSRLGRSRLGLARDRNMTDGSVLRAGPAVTIGNIMVPLREWLRPPKSLLLILVLLSLVSVSVKTAAVRCNEKCSLCMF